MNKLIWKWTALISEGLIADRIYERRDYATAKRYIKAIKRVHMVLTMRGYAYVDEDDMHRYKRFTTWLHQEYSKSLGKLSKPKYNIFFLQTLETIASDTPNFDKYWLYIRKVTLLESSKIYSSL